MRIYGFLMLGFLVIFTSLAPNARASEITPSFIAPLMSWVEARTNTRVPNLPRVSVSRQLMVEKIGNPLRQSALARALYVPGHVVIDDSFWDPSDIRAVSFLVHELVHHAQMYRGVDYECNNTKEYEAYRLQNAWLAEHGLPPVVDESWIARMARCDSSSPFYASN
jgi:hypothetical protein